jgi:hypothetical protein
MRMFMDARSRGENDIKVHLWGMRVLNVLNWLRIKFSGRLLWMQEVILVFLKRRQIYWPIKGLPASQEDLCSIKFRKQAMGFSAISIKLFVAKTHKVWDHNGKNDPKTKFLIPVMFELL